MKLYVSISLVAVVCLVGCFSCGGSSAVAVAQSQEAPNHEIIIGPNGYEVQVEAGDIVTWRNDTDGVMELTLSQDCDSKGIFDLTDGRVFEIASGQAKELTVLPGDYPKTKFCRYGYTIFFEISGRQGPWDGTIRGGH